MARRRFPMAARRARRSTSPALARARATAGAAARKAREATKDRKEMLLAVGGGALAGYVSRAGWKPPTPGSMSVELFYGALLGVAVPMFVKGSAGKNAAAVGLGMLACAARDIGAGRNVIGYDDEIAGDGDVYTAWTPETYEAAGAEVVDV